MVWVTLHDGRHIDIGGDSGKAGDKLSKQGYKLQTAQRNPDTGKASQVWNHDASNHNVYLTHDSGGKITEAHDSSSRSFHGSGNMRSKTPQDIKSDLQNADMTSLTKEDESAATGEDAIEFSTGYSNQPATALEKGCMKGVSPEEMYQAEQMQNKEVPDYPTMILRKSEEEERMQAIQQLRGKPVGQSPEARLPPNALPAGHPQTVPPQKPQIPGAATMPLNTPAPQQPMNPFADYQPPQKPESGLPNKSLPPDFTPLPDMKVTKHDCLTVHGYQPHEEWEQDKLSEEEKFFRQRGLQKQLRKGNIRI